jgi:hypothetical protein
VPGKGSSFAVELPLNPDGLQTSRAGNQALIRQAVVQTRSSRRKWGRNPKGLEQAR